MMYKLLVVFSVFMAASAQMLLKKGASISYDKWYRQYLNLWVIGGYFILGVSLILNVFCLSRGVLIKEVSIIESLSYLFVPLMSWFFFKEKLSMSKFIAICVIMVGIVIFFL